MFHLTEKELENWKSQFATSNKEVMGFLIMTALRDLHKDDQPREKLLNKGVTPPYKKGRIRYRY